jgi:hypothetical protein
MSSSEVMWAVHVQIAAQTLVRAMGMTLALMMALMMN